MSWHDHLTFWSGRRNGKTATTKATPAKGPSADIAVLDEVGDPLAEALAQQQRARIERKRARQALELYRRRYEFPTGHRTGGAQAKVACPHLIARHYDEAHPRYGDRFPITRTVLRRVRGEHECVPGVAR